MAGFVPIGRIRVDRVVRAFNGLCGDDLSARQMRLHLVAVEKLGLYAVLGDVHLRRPGDGVEEGLAKTGMFPVVIEVTAGGRETTAAVRTLDRPGDDPALRFRRG